MNNVIQIYDISLPPKNDQYSYKIMHYPEFIDINFVAKMIDLHGAIVIYIISYE